MLPSHDGGTWIRLGLVEVDYAHYLTRPGKYDWAMESPEATRQLAVLEERQTLDFDKGFIRPTDYGFAFAESVGV